MARIFLTVLLISSSVIYASSDQLGRAIDAGGANNHFQTSEFWATPTYGRSWSGWSIAADDLTRQIRSVSGQDGVVSKDFLHDCFQSALQKASNQANPSTYQRCESGSSGAQNAAFATTRPESKAMAKAAAVIEDFKNSLTETTLKDMTRPKAEGILNKITLPLELRSLLPSKKDNPDAFVTTICDQSEKPVVPLNSFLDPLQQPECAKEKYRAHSGFCNNICFPNRGKKTTVFLRKLGPDYSDLKTSGPRLDSNNKPLPSARLVSSTVIGQKTENAPTWTAMFTEFGQFLSTPKWEDAACCGSSGRRHADCFPITIPDNDPFYARFGQKCMEFIRSLPGVRPGCRLGHREQLNQNTAYIDGSAIYGVNDETIFQVRDVRKGSKGRMDTTAPFSDKPGYTILPRAQFNAHTNKTVVCLDKTPDKLCFIAGDDRCNLHIGLQTMHTIFVRHHNNIVTELSRMPENLRWDDEKLYQEARAIIASQLQHIVFNEYLPVLLGITEVKRRGLTPLQSGRFQGYDVSVDASLTNEFSTAAFRVGHSMVHDKLPRLNEKFDAIGQISVHTTFLKASQFYKEGIVDELVRGMARQAGKIVGPSVTAALSQQPSQTRRIRSLARTWHCKLSTADNFAALKKLKALTGRSVDKFQSVYANVEDIDLYVAGISEVRKPDGIIGATMACIIAEQFGRLRSGDRFWYENDLPLPSRLTNQQLAAIRRTSMASILCTTALAMNAVQPRVFETLTIPGNGPVDCSQIPRLDLGPWRGI
ncbi:Peroxidasin-like protein [Hypsibius exemplaris]|uniref:Peroxidasin-like protein n=1 Tax=Hypsibius exemplaris TaxID=2072580 RepID=A0A9X6RMY3_HYPEX|nr:Peroxidasin-like protein [Hypsibius exemplaris]